MNLRDQLNEILPDILPVEPSEAIKGTALIDLVKDRLKQNYSDATLRYHFSILSRDPSSSIAKVEQGQGYFRRSARSRLEGVGEVVRMTQPLLLAESRNEFERDVARAARVRVLFARHVEQLGKSLVLFTHNQPGGMERESLWKYPDAAMVEWDLQTSEKGEVAIDTQLARIKSTLGAQPFRMTAAKLVLDAENSDFRASFFQCLQNSSWAHRGELVVASSIDDDFIRDTLRDLGYAFGVGVTSLGLSLPRMDEWPDATEIAKMEGREMEALLKAVRPERICDAKSRAHLDWDVIGRLREENPNFERLLAWLADSLESGAPLPFEENAELG